MGGAIPFEIRERAEELYIIDGLTLEQVAAETGVSIASLKKWSSDDGWTERKKEYHNTLHEIRQNTVKLKKQMTEHALNTLDPQVIHAWKAIKLEEKKPGDRKADIDRPKIFLEDLQFVAETLKEIDPEGLKVLSRTFDVIVKRFKAQSAER